MLREPGTGAWDRLKRSNAAFGNTPPWLTARLYPTIATKFLRMRIPVSDDFSG